jgi:hypothetical protein
MLKKKTTKGVNLKGLRKKVLNLEYEQKIVPLKDSSSQVFVKPKLDSSVGGESTAKVKTKNQPSHQPIYRILILRNAPIENSEALASLLKQNREARLNRLSKEDTSVQALQDLLVFSKCIKKTVLKTLFLTKGLLNSPLTTPSFAVNKSTLVQSEGLKLGLTKGHAKLESPLTCKFLYWVAPDATSLKEHFLQLNLLKTYIRAEPKEAFLGCLITSFDYQSNSTGNNSSSVALTQSKIESTLPRLTYKYYYPSQCLNLCKSIDNLASPGESTGLEILAQLLQTIESSVSSVSTLLALKKLTQEKEESMESNKA